MQVKMLNINELNIHYELRNLKQIKTILVLHGWAKTGTLKWQNFLDKLATENTDYKILMLDLPGFGKSSEPKEIWGAENYAIFLDQFLGVLNIFPSIIIAHSFGGAVAVNYLSQQKLNSKNKVSYLSDSISSLPYKDDLIHSKIILLSPALIRPTKGFFKNSIQNIFSLTKLMLLKFRLDSVYTILKKQVYKFYGSTDYLNSSGIMSKIFLKVVNEDFTKLLPEIKNQTLLLWGEQDVQTPIWQAKIIQSKLQNCTLVIFKEARHAIHIQAENEVLVQIRKFLAKQ